MEGALVALVVEPALSVAVHAVRAEAALALQGAPGALESREDTTCESNAYSYDPDPLLTERVMN